jgi:hypothetical protein
VTHAAERWFGLGGSSSSHPFNHPSSDGVEGLHAWEHSQDHWPEMLRELGLG